MKNNNYYNSEGYHDPTVGAVLSGFDKKERSDRRKAIRKENRRKRIAKEAQRGATGNKALTTTATRKPVVYICSPYAGDKVRNILAAQRYCKYAVSCGCIPFAPHLLFTQFLDDDIPCERKLGLSFGNHFMDLSDEIWIFGDRLSSGMQAEYDRARRLGYRIRRFSASCIEKTDSGKGGTDGWV